MNYVENITGGFMNPRIKEKILQGEGITVEFKESKAKIPKNFMEIVVSFLNRYGGYIFLVVKDDGTVVGIEKENISKLKKEIATLCNNEEVIQPIAFLDIQEFLVDEKWIILVQVPNSSEVHRYKGHIFDRNIDGDFDITRSTELVASMYRRKTNVNFEDKIIPELTMKDFRNDLFKKVKELVRMRNRKHPWLKMTNQEILKSANLYRETQEEAGFTLGALLLFGKDEVISRWLSHFKTDAIYRDRNRDRYDDRDYIQTNLIDSYQRLFDFAVKHTDDHFYLNEDMLRVSPRDNILREVISNILIHRDFADKTTSRMIIMKDLENPCTPNVNGFITLENCIPKSKNPNIAKVFREINYADELGSGIRNLTKYVQVYCGEKPILEEGNIFRTTIPLVNHKDLELKTSTVDNNDIVAISANKVTNTGDKVTNTGDKATNTGDKVSSYNILTKKDKILQYFHSHEKVTLLELQNYLELGATRTKQLLKELKEEGLILYLGTTKDRKYILMSAFHENLKNVGIICNYLENKQYISNQEVQDLLKIKSSRANEILSQMVADGTIEAIGNNKGRKYKLKGKEK